MADFIDYAYRAMDFYPLTYKLNDMVANFTYEKKLDIFYFLSNEIKKNSSIRDYIQKEAHIKASLITYLCQNNYYEVLSVVETNKGYADIILNPIHEEISYGAIIELKYLSKKEYNEDSLKQKVNEAKEQLTKYDISKNTHILKEDIKFLKIVLVYRVWELMYCEEL